MKFMDAEKLKNAHQKIISSLKEFVGDRKAIIGLSGGIDSTVIAYLCVEALGNKNVFGLTLPYGDGTDIHTADGELVASRLRIDCAKYDIRQIVDAFPPFSIDNYNLEAGNIMARVRMTILYQFANKLNGMVIGTTNKTEALIGYYTKYGDGAVDVEPIADLYKTEIWQLAELLGVPDKIIRKVPTANLWEGQTDEDEIGMLYRDMDEILFAFYEGGDVISVLETYGGEKVANILRRIKLSEHKKHMPPTFKLR